VLTFSPVTLVAQWVRTLGALSQNSAVFSLTVSGTNLFAGTDVDGIFLTTNNGTNWATVNSGLDQRVHSIVVSGTNLFAGTLGGVFRSTNNGTSWTAVNSGLTSLSIYPLAVNGTNLFAGTSNSGVFLSTNSGTSWTAVNSGLTNLEVNALAVSGTNTFAGTNGGVFLSTNNGTSWTAVNSGLTNSLANAFAVSGINLFVGTFGGGVFLSTNNGTSWTAVNSGLTSLQHLSLFAVDAANILAGTYDGGVFLSTNNGTSWTAVNSGLTNLGVLSLNVSGTSLFLGTSGGSGNGVWTRPLSEIITSVEETTSNEIPSVYALQQNYPNPFNPTTTIEFSIPYSGLITVKVFNTLGQVVATLVDEELQVGRYRTTWDASGFSSGVYYYRMHATSFSETGKLVLIR